MDKNLTTQDLVGILQSLHKTEDSFDDISNIKYMIYARKSTAESEERQVRSLPDQLSECKKLATDKELQLVNLPPIAEAESAKEPDIRPKFRTMIDDIKKGKYHGIIAWHPDRLARNMKDAGEIIDLIDKKIIKDLQFCSFTFENTTAGKMLLGIAFVLSKQYSDQLSDNVKRGIRKSLEEGKYLSIPKQGYYKDANQLLRPDGNNFLILKNAWKMRLEGKTQEEARDYINGNHYTRPTERGGAAHKPFILKTKRLSVIFRDPFYAGVLNYGKKVVDLTEIYDFVPMITVDEFMKINRISNINKIFNQRYRNRQEGAVKADFLRGKVICGYCNQPMSSGLTTKKGPKRTKNYYYYRCETDNCKFEDKSVRAKIVVEFVDGFLKTHRFTSRKVYQHYISEMARVATEQNELLVRQRASLTQAISHSEDKIEKIKGYLLDESDIMVKDTFKNDLKAAQDNLKQLLKDLETVKNKVKSQKGAVLSYKKFLELFDNLAVRLAQTQPIKGKDFIIQKIFSNFTVKDKKVSSYQLNQPFKEFVDKGLFLSSRGERT